MANPIKFEQIADLEKGIKKAISDLQTLDKTTKKVFKSMSTEGDKLEKSLKSSKGALVGLGEQLKVLNPAIEKDRKGIVELDAALKKKVVTIDNLKGATNGLANTQKVAADSVAGLKKRVKELSDQFNKLSASSDPRKIQRLGTEIQKTRTQIKTLNDVTRRTVNTFNSAQGSYNALIKQNERLSAILRRLPVEFVKTNRRAQALVATMNRNTVALKGFDSAIGRNFRNVGNYRSALGGLRGTLATSLTALTGVTLGLAGAALAFRGVVNNTVEFDQALADTARTTNLTKNQVRELSKQLELLNTRTSQVALLGIAEIGGRIGVASSELLGFVEAVDLANVALGDTFSSAEDVATVLARLNLSFKETSDLSTGEGIQRIASVLNELGQSTEATEDQIAELARRLGTLPAALKPSIQGALAIATAITRVGIKAETGARAITIFLRNAAREIPAFARQMGISARAAEDLINTDVTKFIRDFALSIKGLSGPETAKVFKDLALNATGVTQAIGAISNNIEGFDTVLTQANDEFERNASVAKEAALQNQTLGARIDQLKKSFFNATTEGSAFGRVIGAIVDSITELVDGKSAERRAFLLDLEKLKTIDDRLISNFKSIAEGDDRQTNLADQAKRIAEEQVKLNELRRRTIDFGLTGNAPGAKEAAQALDDQIAKSEATILGLTRTLSESQKALNDFGEELGNVEDEGALTEDQLDAVNNSIQGIEKITPGAIAALKKLEEAFKTLDPESNVFDEVKKAFDTLQAKRFNEENTGEFESTLDPFGGRTFKETRDRISEVLEIIKDGNKDRVELEQELQNELTDLEEAAEEERSETRRQLRDETIARSIDLANVLFDIQFARLDNELRALEQQKLNELQIVGDNEQAKVELEDRFNAKERELRIQQAKADKAQALFNIAISTAVGIARAFEKGKLVAPVLAAIVLATGLAQAAIVASQPIPAFAEGGTSPGGVILVGEEGPELMQTGPGEYHRFGHPTLVDSPRGARIFDAIDTQKMEDNIFAQQTMNSMSVEYPEPEVQTIKRIQFEIQQSNAEVVQAIERNTKAIKGMPKITERLGINDTYIEIKRRNERQLYLNKKYRLP